MGNKKMRTPTLHGVEGGEDSFELRVLELANHKVLRRQQYTCDQHRSIAPSLHRSTPSDIYF